jgi:zinc protease
MKTIYRTTPPPINTISEITFPQPKISELSNGAKIWGLKAGSQELIKIDFIFEAGSWYQQENLVAGLSNAFMNQGSQKHSAQQIAEIYDFHGSYLQLTADQQYGHISILTLKKYVEKILAVTADMLYNPTYPEKEVMVQIAKRKQHFIIENNKVKTLAFKKFTQALFGSTHPYSNNNVAGDFDLLNNIKLHNFQLNHYDPGNCKILVSGQYDDNTIHLLEKHFGEKRITTPRSEPIHIIKPSTEKFHFVEKADSVQSAIRIGKIVIDRHHPDFHGLSILNTILGGYFGSRLMSNIREDKGYTYGIGSSIVSYKNLAYFSIITDVGTDVCNKAIEEIIKEVTKVNNEPIPLSELEIVKNYLLGEMLRGVDGVFALSATVKSFIEENLELSFIDQYVETIHSITPAQLMEIAQKHLNPDDMFIVVAGKELR